MDLEHKGPGFFKGKPTPDNLCIIQYFILNEALTCHVLAEWCLLEGWVNLPSFQDW